MLPSDLFSLPWGAIPFGDLKPYLSPKALGRAEAICPEPAGVIVLAAPYFSGQRPGNLALYARGEDYHRAVPRLLEAGAERLRVLYPGRRFVTLCDASPLPEKRAAVLAGLGELGGHGLLMVPPYGSWVLLGTLLTDLPLERQPAKTQPGPGCSACGACRAACPAEALSDAGLDRDRCLSAISQKKGELSPEETELLKNAPLAWGCDLCQIACPVNRSAAESAVESLRGEGASPYLAELNAGELAAMEESDFQERYGDRAFAWRGRKTLLRNLELQGGRRD